jgi:hypothetical protein
VAWFIVVFATARFRAVELITILNLCPHFRGFVYHRATFSPDRKSIEISVRPRKGSAAVCSRCISRLPEHVVTWGLEHRSLGQIDAIGVDEIQYAKGHKYLTLVYQIDIGITRLLWVGKELESVPPPSPPTGRSPVLRSEQDHKLGLLQSLLQRDQGSFLVSARTKHGADRLTRRLADRGVRTAAIHGDRSQINVTRLFADFKPDRIEC